MVKLVIYTYSLMNIISTEWRFYHSSLSTALLHISWSGRHLGSAWPLTRSVLITSPYHWPGTQINLTAGPATDLRGYEPNEPAHWWDGFRQVIPESPWGVLPQSQSSPPSASSVFPSSLYYALLHFLPSFFKKFACEKQLHDFFVIYIYISHQLYVSQIVTSQCNVCDIGRAFCQTWVIKFYFGVLEVLSIQGKLKSVNCLRTTRNFRNK